MTPPPRPTGVAVLLVELSTVMYMYLTIRKSQLPQDMRTADTSTGKHPGQVSSLVIPFTQVT
jgi:hypothetical protein